MQVASIFAYRDRRLGVLFILFSYLAKVHPENLLEADEELV